MGSRDHGRRTSIPGRSLEELYPTWLYRIGWSCKPFRNIDMTKYRLLYWYHCLTLRRWNGAPPWAIEPRETTEGEVGVRVGLVSGARPPTPLPPVGPSASVSGMVKVKELPSSLTVKHLSRLIYIASVPGPELRQRSESPVNRVPCFRVMKISLLQCEHHGVRFYCRIRHRMRAVRVREIRLECPMQLCARFWEIYMVRLVRRGIQKCPVQCSEGTLGSRHVLGTGMPGSLGMTSKSASVAAWRRSLCFFCVSDRLDLTSARYVLPGRSNEVEPQSLPGVSL